MGVYRIELHKYNNNTKRLNLCFLKKKPSIIKFNERAGWVRVTNKMGQENVVRPRTSKPTGICDFFFAVLALNERHGGVKITKNAKLPIHMRAAD